jgi:hypothetical protein
MPMTAQVRTAALLRSVADSTDTPHLTVGDLVDRFGRRSYGVVLLVLALPCFIPGVATVFAVPMAFVAAQLALGRQGVWLPGRLARYGLDRDQFRRMTDRVEPWLKRIERLSRPRLEVLTNGVWAQVIGAEVAVLAAIVTLPFVFTNALPGISVALMALGLAERDGALVLAGALLGVAAAALVVAAGFGAVFSAVWLGEQL